MDISTFQTFLAAASAGSFAGAAQRVNASPSSVTERIKQLETRLGAILFERDKRGCRLTPAGERFLKPARQAVRAWEFARHEIALPERFSRTLHFGGQYLLWERFLVAWLTHARVSLPDVAMHVTAGASARLNRELAEGMLDVIVVHDPVFRTDIKAEPVFEDQLMLVSGGDPERWREDFVRIDWGNGLGLEIAARLDIEPQAGLVLDLGYLSGDWLSANRMAGYMPASAVAIRIAEGKLHEVKDAPRFDYPAYACWRLDLDAALAAEVVATLQAAVLMPRV